MDLVTPDPTKQSKVIRTSVPIQELVKHRRYRALSEVSHPKEKIEETTITYLKSPIYTTYPF